MLPFRGPPACKGAATPFIIKPLHSFIYNKEKTAALRTPSSAGHETHARRSVRGTAPLGLHEKSFPMR